MSDIRPNSIYEIDESAVEGIGASERQGVRASERGSVQAETPEDHAPRSSPHVPPFFEDASSLLAHTHIEEPFDDFQRQPLMPNRLSQLGPGICWHDLDGDGWEDLFVGSGKGGSLAIYRNKGLGGFTQVRDAEMTRVTTRDHTTILGAGARLFIGLSNYEDGLTNGICLRVFDFKNRSANDTFNAQPSSSGPMALADIDGDGDLDLFVGGRTIPARYPEPATSLLLRNDEGKFLVGQRFEKIGLVSGAVFSDLDGDGTAELILACEWGPVRVLRAANGTYKEVTEKLGLADYLGWWNGVTTGDLDGDGRLDIIATNWGLNSKYRTNRMHPRRLYYGDLSGNGTVDLVEALYDEALGKEVPERNLRAVGAALPFVRAKMQTFEAYGNAGLLEILGEETKKLHELPVTILASMVFFNRGDHFEAAPLPREAQFSPAFGVGVSDLDGDGNEDLFLSQNCFAATPETTRNDAGRGLWLRGVGRGALESVPGQESGVKIYGEQRGCALADFNGDGRVDLAVTQNGNETKLYRNLHAKPGLRVRLRGAPGNPSGIGAAMKLIFGKRSGPAREVHAGAGYWSQDSVVQVLGSPEPPTEISIRWPGGKTLATRIPPGAHEIAVDSNGRLEVIR